MSKIQVNGTKALMAQFAPQVAAMLQGDWVQVDDKTKIKVPDQVGVEVVAANGKTTITFDQPLPIQALRGWGPFQGKFSGTIEAVVEIDVAGATLRLGGMPDQVLEWAP
jgi:hypothetical protein